MASYKGVSIDDKDIVYVKLPSGMYLVDGEIVNVDSWSNRRVQCKNPDDIRIVNENRYIKEYRYGEEVLPVQEYEEQRAKLAAECIVETSNDDDTVYKDLDSEFKFRRFVGQWTPIYATKQTISKPIKVEIEHILYDTGNEFITSAFLSGNNKINEDDTLYSYNQSGAWLQIVKNCFSELGMEYRDNVGCYGTQNKRIWSNSNHSCIEFVVAFGTYLFDKSYKNPRILTGTLDDMKGRYEKDKESIRNIIIQKYYQHFGNIKAGTFDFARLLDTLKTCSTNLHAVSSKVQTRSCYDMACRSIKDAIDQIEAAYYEEE